MLTFPLMFGIISVAYKFVPIFYGDGYDKVAPLLCIISPIIVLIGLSNVMGTQYLLPTKQQNKYTISVIVGACVNFLFNTILIKNLASIGASIATVIAELSVTLTQFFLIKKEIKFSDVLKISYKYIIASVIMFGVSIFVGNLILDNLLSIIVQVVCSFICYFIILLLMKDKMIFEGLELIKLKMNNKSNYVKEG